MWDYSEASVEDPLILWLRALMHKVLEDVSPAETVPTVNERGTEKAKTKDRYRLPASHEQHQDG